MKPLDFLIIGAQKSATTVLHRYLGEHPAIAMPASKEVPYFTDSEAEAESWQAFSRKWFRHADPTVLWGKATPQYMADHRVPGRIHALMPNTKLIAILRDPIDRAWSHYQMARRRETETRDFEGAMRFAMDPDVLRSARSSSVPKHEHGYEAEDNFYLAWSEYGRILLEYQRYFPREQILVLLTEDLRQDPGRELDRVLSFLGLNPGYRPASFGKIVHKGKTTGTYIMNF